MEQVPFDITKYEKYEEERFSIDMYRFGQLYSKYKNEIEDVLEFTRLYYKFMPKENQ